MQCRKITEYSVKLTKKKIAKAQIDYMIDIH